MRNILNKQRKTKDLIDTHRVELEKAITNKQADKQPMEIVFIFIAVFQ